MRVYSSRSFVWTGVRSSRDVAPAVWGDNHVAMGAADVWSDVGAGNAALSRCNWTEGRAAFERAVRAGAGPEAMEGLAQAAFFLDEPAVRIDMQLVGDRGAAFTEACRYADGTNVLCAAVLELRDGQIARQVGVQAWDE
jgi:hypothetical protein